MKTPSGEANEAILMSSDLDTNTTSLQCHQGSGKLHRVTFVAVILGLVVCVTLVLFPPHSHGSSMKSGATSDSISLSYGGSACCHGGCNLTQCRNCGDTPGGRIGKEACNEWGGTWCKCACSSGGQKCSEA
mmetsp:Transcript_132208/g.263821  ORF Transcript_132208/g.263821 Transcript_132208/m.263821 type:complete len:131 (+) Transcript_132208:68-460(+)